MTDLLATGSIFLLVLSFVKVDYNIQAPFGGGGGGQNGHENGHEATEYEGEEGGEGVAEGHQNGQAGGAMGFAASLMMKAKSLKEGVTEKSGGLNIGNVQVGSSFISLGVNYVATISV